MVILVVKATKSPANPDGNKLAVQLANVAGFGVLWILKYIFLDKIMFGPEHHTPYDEDIEVEEEELVENEEELLETFKQQPATGRADR